MARELEELLDCYEAPRLDPDVVTQGIHAALNQPAPARRRPVSRLRWTSPLPVFMAGGLATAAALVLFVLPMAGLEIRPARSLDAQVAKLVRTQQMAEAELSNADEVFGLLETPEPDPVDELLRDVPDDRPVWDVIMGRS